MLVGDLDIAVVDLVQEVPEGARRRQGAVEREEPRRGAPRTGPAQPADGDGAHGQLTAQLRPRQLAGATPLPFGDDRGIEPVTARTAASIAAAAVTSTALTTPAHEAVPPLIAQGQAVTSDQHHGRRTAGGDEESEGETGEQPALDPLHGDGVGHRSPVVGGRGVGRLLGIIRGGGVLAGRGRLLFRSG